MKNITREIPLIDRKKAPGIHYKFPILLAVTASAMCICPQFVSATSLLGTAQSFAVLAHETVTNGHNDPNVPTQVYGNLGVTPGTSVTGLSSGGTLSGGTMHINDGVAQRAMADATTAYNTLASQPFDYDYSGIVLGSAGYNILTPGVYHFASSAQVTGALTLDFQGNPNADFIFQIGSALTTASSASVTPINGNSLSGVYWQVGSSATLGTDTTFAGNIIALTSITLDPRAAVLCGRALALTGAVTMTDNLFSNNNTVQDFGTNRPDFGSYGFSGGSVQPMAPVPEPTTMILLGSGLTGLATFRKKSQKGLIRGSQLHD